MTFVPATRETPTGEAECAIINGMIELLGPNGEHWTTGTMQRTNAAGEDQYCLYGAFRKVVAGDDYRPRRQHSVPNAAHAQIGWFGRRCPNLARLLKARANQQVFDGTYRDRVISFNDQTGRTFAEIAEILAQAKAAACPDEAA